MNWKKLTKEKKKQLILVVVLAIGVLNGLGFGLIRFQYGKIKLLAEKRVTVNKKLKQMQDEVRRADKVEAEMKEVKKSLANEEQDMASGDLYAWMINTVRAFRLGYKVEIPQFSPAISQGDVNLLPNFPYKQASVTVAGTSHYHDFGKFLADFENQFPHIRIVNLRMDSNPTANAGESQETISFAMEIVALVKST
jgi:Tfp pilus assembly protein PilO